MGIRDVSAGGHAVADGNAEPGRADAILSEGDLTFPTRRCSLSREVADGAASPSRDVPRSPWPPKGCRSGPGKRLYCFC